MGRNILNKCKVTHKRSDIKGMIKKISTSELRPGMFVDNLDCGWMEHPFLKNRFLVKDSQMIQKIASAGIRHLYIDTDKGKDVEAAPSLEAVEQDLQAQLEEAAGTGQKASSDIAAELAGSRRLFREATSVIRNMMEDARLGKQVQVNALEPVAERMVQLVMRNHHALTSVTRIKTKDEYTFMHCVSVAGLMSTFAREMGMSDDVVQQVALGGLVHDIGKTLVPSEVLNKPGKLDDQEFDVMKGHVNLSGQILQESLGLSQIALDVTMLHHERMDGTGYPLGLSGNKISEIGQMSAIVDVYDALTSVRVYKNAWEPTQTLKKLLEWSPAHFNRELVQRFIHCLGIYPVGTLVELDSGLVGIVTEPGEDLLKPKLRIIYNARKQCYIKVHEVNLARAGSDRITNAVSSAQYNIDLSHFI